MSERVKPVRRYDSSGREEQARQNRWRVLQCARARFLEQGYAATTIGQIAGDAGVSVQTVYAVFANKAGLLKAVSDVAIAGDDEPVAMVERDFIQSVIRERDASRKLAMYFKKIAGDAVRSSPLQLLARDAAAADPAAADVWAQMRAELLNAMTQFAGNLAETGQLREGLTVEDVRDILWAYHAPELFELLVMERGWTAERYGEFLTAALRAALLTGKRPRAR
jgi:AcrR family transcriptional regulator